MKKIKGVAKLTRAKDLSFSLTVVSLAGLYSKESISLIQFIFIGVATYLAIMFAFMINDVEDAEDDALHPKKAQRNAISSGYLSKLEGYIACGITAIISLVLYLVFGNIQSFLLCGVTILLGLLYSWKTIRLKNRPFFDMFSHGLFLGGLVFITPFLAFGAFRFSILIPFFAVCAFALDGSLYNQLRDFEVDRKAGLKNTASVIGQQNSIYLRMGLKMLSILGLFAIVFTTLNQYYLPVVVPIGLILLGIIAYLLLIQKKSTHMAHVNNIIHVSVVVMLVVSIFLS